MGIANGNNGEEREELMRKESGGIVSVNPKPNKGFTSKAIDWIEKLIVNFLYDSSLPHHWLSGNFAPVPETPPSSHLPVSGHLPVSITTPLFISLFVFYLRIICSFGTVEYQLVFKMEFDSVIRCFVFS